MSWCVTLLTASTPDKMCSAVARIVLGVAFVSQHSVTVPVCASTSVELAEILNE